jgi:hypothetical protein
MSVNYFCLYTHTTRHFHKSIYPVSVATIKKLSISGVLFYAFLPTKLLNTVNTIKADSIVNIIGWNWLL